jgi:hypothetical protein
VGDVAEQLGGAVDRMVEVKERRDALDAEYTRLRDIVIQLSGVGRRDVDTPMGSLPVTVSARRAFDPRVAMTVLDAHTLALITPPVKPDSKLAREHLSQADYERCLSETITYNVRLG